MRKKTTIRLIKATFVILAVSGIFGAIAYITGSSCHNSQLPGNEDSSGKIIWENLSHQFFTTF